MAQSSNLRSLLLLLLSSGFLLAGLLFDYMPSIVDTQIKSNFELATNEPIRSIWTRPPVDLHSFFWLYEIVNSDEFMVGQRVKVRKVGPFHFTSRPEKRVLELSQNKYRLTYNSTRNFKQPNETLSEQQRQLLEEPLKLLNPVYVTLTENLRQSTGLLEPQTKQMMVSSANRLTERFNESLIIQTTARQALLGRKLELIEKARKLIETFGLDTKLPSGQLKDDTFGYLAAINGTWNGPFEIYTGFGASSGSLGELISYQGRRRLAEFSGRCNRMQASLGELRPMPLQESQMLEIFQPSFCRLLHLEPVGVRKLREGQAIGYRLAERDFLSAQNNPDNQCFCINGTGDNYCSLNGAIELAPCAYFSPILLTTSSIQLDDRITNSVANWSPELVDSSIEGGQFEFGSLEPNSSQTLILKRLGVPAQVDLTLTLFMKVVRDPQFRLTSSVPEVSYVPIVMVRETGQIPPRLGQLVVNLENFLAFCEHMKVIMYLSAIVLLCWLSGRHYRRPSKDRVAPGVASGADRPAGNGISPAGSLDAGAPSGGGGGSGATRARQTKLDPGPAQPSPRARVFSKLDEELSIQSGRKERARQIGATRRPLVKAGAAAKPAASMEVGGPDRLAKEDRVDGGAGDMLNEPEDADQRLARKSWFMKVCSNFVRMLSGIRRSVNEASQLDISENDYQDKQLELLAGKIDNWYGGKSELACGGGGQQDCGETAQGEGTGGQMGEQAGQSASEVERQANEQLGLELRDERLAATDGESPSASEDPSVDSNPLIGDKDDDHDHDHDTKKEELGEGQDKGANDGRESEEGVAPVAPVGPQSAGELVADLSERNRSDSVQSNQTVISTNISEQQGFDAESSTTTLGPSRGLQAEEGKSLERAQPATKHERPGERRLSMVDSSTSMDLGDNLNEEQFATKLAQPNESSSPSGSANGASDANKSGAAAASSALQSEKFNDKFDELSLDLGKQFNMFGQASEIERSHLDGRPLKLIGSVAKDERRDSGVKLDSRNGINDLSIGPVSDVGAIKSSLSMANGATCESSSTSTNGANINQTPRQANLGPREKTSTQPGSGYGKRAKGTANGVPNKLPIAISESS